MLIVGESPWCVLLVACPTNEMGRPWATDAAPVGKPAGQDSGQATQMNGAVGQILDRVHSQQQEEQ